MREIGPFDKDLHQFVENPPVNMAKMLYNRWLAENGKFGHQPFSKPAGEYALAIAVMQEPKESVQRKTNGTS